MHGDDITTLGIGRDLDWLEVELGKSFELKNRGRVGIDLDGDNDIRILNRVAAVSEQGVTYDRPRHVDIILSSLGLTAANSVVTPGIKEHDADPDILKVNESTGTPMTTADAPMINAVRDCERSVPSTVTDSRMHIASVSHEVKSILGIGSSISRGQIYLTGSLHDKT